MATCPPVSPRDFDDRIPSCATTAEVVRGDLADDLDPFLQAGNVECKDWDAGFCWHPESPGRSSARLAGLSTIAETLFTTKSLT